MHIKLPAWHYASAWPLEKLRSPEELTGLGLKYFEAAGRDKEDLGLELLQAFHPYLIKYLNMIARGHLPRYGNHGQQINEDAKRLLITLLPKGEQVSRVGLMRACKHLHLAFRGYEPAEFEPEGRRAALNRIEITQSRPPPGGRTNHRKQHLNAERTLSNQHASPCSAEAT